MKFHVESKFEVKNIRFLCPEGKDREKENYAHIEIVVAFLVVNFCWFFGHSSESSQWILTKIGGNDSYRPPKSFYTVQVQKKPKENQNFRDEIFEKKSKNLTTISI